MMKKEPRWIRVAGHRENLRSGNPERWRCVVDGEEVNLKHWNVRGEASEKNNIPGTNPEGDEHGLIAWIDYYGRPEILREELFIFLEEPPPDKQQPTP